MRIYTNQNRRSFLQYGSLALFATATSRLRAEQMAELSIAAAGSIRTMLEGPLKTAAATALHLTLTTHAGGADTIAKTLQNGTLKADIFLPITASPMQALQKAGLAATAYPIARTELVLAYSPASRFAAQLDDAANGKASWWEIVQQPGFRIGRGNPTADPSARAILFAMMLAAKKYNQPKLVEKSLGQPMNPDQIVPNIIDRLTSGELDAIATYKIGIAHMRLPYVSLTEDINLSRDDAHTANPEISLTLEGNTWYPEPLIFYASQLKNSANASGASSFLSWLQSQEAQSLFLANQFLPRGNTPGLPA